MPLADRHSLDIPHVSCVELPLNVKNPDRAIAMLGGSDRIASVINLREKGATATAHTPLSNTLELRLRENDPFHHPIPSLYLSHERVLLKVLIPKLQLPENYQNMNLKEIINHTSYKVKPMAIIDKTYSFKLISDFQVSHKNNPMAQEYANDFANVTHLDELKTYFNNHQQFTGLKDWESNELFENKDQNLIAPPNFSQIRFPFDYRFEMNPATMVTRDDNGENKVVPTQRRIKLHSIIIEWGVPIPTQPMPPNKAHLDEMVRRNKEMTLSIHEASLFGCIEWLNQLFEARPFWVRKHLDDITPPNLRKHLKQALPYVSYLFKSGPWRFCNIKYGVDPSLLPKYWKYQTEYFRIPHHKEAVAREQKNKTYDNCSLVTPPTLQGNKYNLQLLQKLLYTGEFLPVSITFQLGDLMDEFVVSQLEDANAGTGFRDVPDISDGWLNRQTMETIRRLMRYKLNAMAKEEDIKVDKIYNIIEGDYLGAANVIEEEGGVHDDEREDDDDEDDEDEDVDENQNDVDGDDVLARIKQLEGTDIGDLLKEVIGFIKQQ